MIRYLGGGHTAGRTALGRRAKLVLRCNLIVKIQQGIIKWEYIFLNSTLLTNIWEYIKNKSYKGTTN